MNYDRIKFPMGLLILLMAIGFVFGRGLSHSFLNFDDDIHLTANPLLNPVSLKSLLRFWTEPYENLYIPVSYTFFAAEAKASTLFSEKPLPAALSPMLFKFGSLFLHCGCTVLVLQLLRSFGITSRGAVAGALIFAVHPLQVESVAWISETRGLLATFLGLLAVILHLQIHRTEGEIDKRHPAFYLSGRPWLHLASCLFFLLALLAKPSAAGLAIMAGVLSVGVLKKPVPLVAIRLTPWLLLVGFVAILSRNLQTGEQASSSLGLFARCYVALDSLGFYLMKTAVPWRLGIDYGRTPAVAMTWKDGPLFLFALMAIGIAVRLRSNRTVLASFGVFLAGLAPTLGLVPFGFQEISTVADRYAYSGMIGVAMAFAGLWSRFTQSSVRILIVLVSLCFCVLSHLQVTTWSDSESLYRNALKVNPGSWLSLNNLGDVFAQRGDYKTAENYFLKATEINSTHANAWRNLGVCAEQFNDLTRGLECYRRGIEANPHHVGCRWSLANGLRKQGSLKESAEQFEIAVSISPDNAVLWADFGTLLFQTDQILPATEAFERSLNLQPEDWATRVNLANCFLKAGRELDAIVHYQKALAVNSDAPGVHHNLGLLLLRQGQYADAAKHMEKVISDSADETPETVAATKQELTSLYNTMGLESAGRGDLRSATQSLSRAVELDSGFVAGHFNLARVYLQGGNSALAKKHLAELLTLVPKDSEPFRDATELLNQIDSP